MDTFNIFNLVTLLGGLAMFLYGMEVMGDGLKQCSGGALKRVLGKLTQNPFLGLLTGTLVTAVIQSSTATIVLTVGLIGAGILSLRQAVSIVLGANIGTTVTAQIIRLMDIDSNGSWIIEIFKPSTLAPVALIAGIILIMFIKKDSLFSIGRICIGFGLLFIGIMTMTDAVEPLSESAAFSNALAAVANSPFLGIIIGLVLTVIVQSSSAMVGILQALSSTGAITFNLAYPVIMGINLGTCVTTAMVCSIGSSKDAKRTGIVHILFNTIGTILFMIVMTILRRAGAFSDLWSSVADSGSIANFQTLFNLVTAIILLPFTNLLVKASISIVKPDKVKPEEYPELNALDEKLYIAPSMALTEASRSVSAMCKAARDNLELGYLQLIGYNQERTADIKEREEKIDSFADKADNFFIGLSKCIETPADNRQLNMLMQSVPNLERIGDYATNFDELAEKLAKQNLSFSQQAIKELGVLFEAVNEITKLTITALAEDDAAIAKRIEPLEEVIDDMVLLLKERHTERLRQGVCVINAGIVFIEVLTYMERAADQCSGVAMLMLARDNNTIQMNHHAYLRSLHADGGAEYKAEFKMRHDQYMVKLENAVG